MFRLVFLTFHGERRREAHPEPSPDAPSHHAPTHPRTLEPSHHHLHDAPPAMALALIVLAVGSLAAGYIGVPHALGGHNLLAEWLAPSFQAQAAPGAGAEAAGGAAALPEAEAAELAETPEETALELTLMGVSSAIAIGGIALAAFIWLRRRELADALARRFAGLYRLLLNKYYVDEAYDATVVEPIRVASEEALWRGVDIGVIDGAVNGTGSLVAGGSGVLRRLQTGSVRAYAGAMFIGVIAILGYYLWR
jgi:NADH-quinone oxidoreductase subunit L